MKAYKEFYVEEGSMENLWYKVTVRQSRGGPVIEEFIASTMVAAHQAFERAGYKRVYAH